MEEKQKTLSATGFSGKYLVASLFILSGILLFARNMGWITAELFSTIVSWYSLFIILGIYSMIRRHFVGGIILLLIFKSRRRGPWSHSHMAHHRKEWMKRRGLGMNFKEEQQQCESVDGFLHADNVWGAARHVVLDELFKGAIVRTSFGGTVIDLRHTHIALGETYIDLDCSWGGVEIYVPSDWKVVFKCNTFFGGCDDKRWHNGDINHESILVVRGTLSFGGLEIKD